MTKVKEYCKENKARLKELAKHGEPTIKSMALAILKVGGESDEIE